MDEQSVFSLLEEAYECFKGNDIMGYSRRMRVAKKAIDALPRPGALYGEWLLLSAPFTFNNLDLLLELYKEASDLIDGHSGILPYRCPFFWDHYNALAICNVVPGHAKENLSKLREAVKLFYRLTGGGEGTDICYQAQLAYYQGNLTEARELSEEAFDIAGDSRQWLAALNAANLMAFLGEHFGDNVLWKKACNYIRAASDGKIYEGQALREHAQVISAVLDMHRGNVKNVPPWIQKGNFGAISAPWGYQIVRNKICHSVLPGALLARMRYAFYKGDQAAALNIGDMIQKVYGIEDVITSIYLEFFRAECYMELDYIEGVENALKRAVELIVPDSFWMTGAVFWQPFGDRLQQVAAKEGAEIPAQIQDIGESFRKKPCPSHLEIAVDDSAELSPREQEVAALLLKGKKNAEIARILNISVRTVGTHLENIYRKYKINRRTQLSEALRKNAVETAVWINEQHILRPQ